MSLPRYPKYKDSGVEWLGEVPVHWQVIRLKYLVDKVGSGKTPLGGSEVYTSEGVLFLRSQNVYDEGLRLDDAVFIAPKIDQEMANTRVEAGDILLNVTGASIGRTCLVPTPFVNANVNQHVCIIRISETAQQEFIAQVMKAAPIKIQIAVAQGGAARDGLNFDQIRGLVFGVTPEPGERDAIVSFLSRETGKIDALVEEQRRLIELLKEKRQAVISHAVTKGLNPDVHMKDSGIEWLGKIPAHWEIKPFRSCIDFQEGPGIMATDFQDSGIPLLRVSGVQHHWATLEGCNYLNPDRVTEKWEHFRLHLGDLLISASASMGTVCEVGPETVGSVPYTGLIRLKGIAGRMIKSFLRQMVVSTEFITQIDLLKAGATIQHFGPTHLSRMTIVRPPIEEQVVISAYLDREATQLDELTAAAIHAIDLLQERRTALISAAVTGKIDVRGLAKEDAA